MKTNNKRILSLLLAILMLFSVMPAGTIAASAATLTLSQLKSKFPQGKYWNHVGLSSNNENGYTSTPCPSHSTTSTCNAFTYGGTKIGWQCFGFACKLGYDAYGSNPKNWERAYNLDNIKPGDIINYDGNNPGHTVFVTGVSGDIVYFAECNYGGRCLIRWDRSLKKSQFNNLYSVYVAPKPLVNYSKPGAPKNINLSTVDGKLNISWSTVSDATSYLVYVYTKSNCSEYALKKEVTTASINNISLSPGRYWIYIYAQNSAGTSEAAGPIDYITAPANVKAYCYGNKLKINWSAVPGANCYDVIVTDPSGIKNWYHSNSTSREIEISKTGTYKVEVQSLYRNNGSVEGQVVGAHSSEIASYVGLLGPLNVKVNVVNNKFRITWNPVSGANCYDVIVTNPDGVKKWYHSTETNKDIPIDKPGVYKFDVQSLYRLNDISIGQTVGSHSEEISYAVELTAPKNIKVSSNDSINFSWDYVTGATCYDVVITKPDGKIVYLHSHMNLVSTEVLSENLENGVYKFWIQAIYRPDCPDTTGQIAGKHSEIYEFDFQKKEEICAHKWDNGVITKPATCTVDGVKTYTCTVCGETKTEQIAKTNHNIVIDPEVKATCTTSGRTEGSHCSVCGVVIEQQSATAPLGHKYDNGRITTQANCNHNGVKTYTCTTCRATKTETIAKTSHNYSWKNSGGYIVNSCGNCGNEKVRLPFTDLAAIDYHQYADYIEYTSVNNQFITGTNPPANTVFSPTRVINRAMMVTILYRMAGEPYANGKNPYTSSPFTDIGENPNVYYYDAACWALKNGITTETTFKPFNNVTREQTATFLYRYAQDNDMLGDEDYKNVNLNAYHDGNSISHFAVDAMKWANYNGMITGTEQGYANPQGATQRIHATKILYGFGKVCNIGNFD